VRFYKTGVRNVLIPHNQRKTPFFWVLLGFPVLFNFEKKRFNFMLRYGSPSYNFEVLKRQKFFSVGYGSLEFMSEFALKTLIN